MSNTTIKLKLWTITTCAPMEGIPGTPEIFTSEAAAEAHAEECLRSEWEYNAPSDESGADLPYPGNWRAAQEAILENRGGESDIWGEWKIDFHEIKTGNLAIAMEGGFVSNVLSDGALAGQEITVIDYDTYGVDDTDLTPVTQDGGDDQPALVSQIKIEASTEWLHRALAAINTEGT